MAVGVKSDRVGCRSGQEAETNTSVDEKPVRSEVGGTHLVGVDSPSM